MCGRFTLRVPSNVLVQQFLLDVAPPALSPRYNIAPTQDVAAVRRMPDTGQRRLDFLRWGLVPAWSKDPKMGSRLINARAETVAEKPTFRASFKRRRCLIPADGYFEWQAVGKKKQPYHLHLPENAPFAIAGLWDAWRGGEPEKATPLETCTLITTEASPLARAIHDRMPVILEPVDYDLWLDSSVQDPERLLPLLRPYEGELVVDAVGTRVNSPRHDDESCLVQQRELF